MGDFGEPNSGSPPSQSDVIDPGHWARPEEAAQMIIRKVQPMLVSEAVQKFTWMRGLCEFPFVCLFAFAVL